MTKNITNKDWTGNKSSTYTCLGASNHAEHDREEHDFYATEPIAGKLLLELHPELDNIWENACGSGHLAKIFDKAGKLGLATDLINRGYSYGYDSERPCNFLVGGRKWDGDIVTNPPYKHAQEFVEKSLEAVEEGRLVCMFLKVTFLEGKARKDFFKKYPPKYVYVSSSRIPCALNGEFEQEIKRVDKKTGKAKITKQKVSSAVAYAWYVWEKGFVGETTLRWFN